MITRVFTRRLLENYCFVLLANKAPPQISDNWPDMRHRALFVTSRAAWRWNKMLLARDPGTCVGRYWTGSDSEQETLLDATDTSELFTLWPSRVFHMEKEPTVAFQCV